MNAAIGLTITVVMVFGGYILAGGKMDIILHSLPFEMMMIGGAATGAFVAANDFSTIKHTMGDLATAFAGPKWKKKDVDDALAALDQCDEPAHASMQRLNLKPIQPKGLA